MIRSYLHRAGHRRVGRLLGDAALAGGNVDIAVGTPGAAPRVLHLDASITVDADSSHTVIEVAATSGSDGSALVLLEHGLVRLDGNRNRPRLDGIGQGRGAGAVLVASDSTRWDGSGEAALASSITGSVC